MAAPTDEPRRDIPRTRPVWVWIIAICTAIGWLFGGLSVYLVVSGKIPVSPIRHAYFASLTPLDYVVIAMIGICNAGSAISLFLLRKAALPLYTAGLALNVAQIVWEIAYRNLLAVSGPVQTGLGPLLAVAIVLYVANLSKKGVLT
jgi:hypothetical protein